MSLTVTTTKDDGVTITAVCETTRSEYPVGVPDKFSADGEIQHYPGNTTLCHLPANSPLLPGLEAFYNAFSQHPSLSKKVALLPPASWHMTVFDGVRERECEPGMWPDGMDKLALADATAQFVLKLQNFGKQLQQEGLTPPYRMRVLGFDNGIVGSGLVCEGATVEERKRMRRLRDRLADTLGFRAPNHESYQFHISTLYLLRHMDGEDKKEFGRIRQQSLPALQLEFDLGAVEFCIFENMNVFHRLFYLGVETAQ